MRINKWIATHSGRGRRTVDDLIAQQKVMVNGIVATLGQEVDGSEKIVVEGKLVEAKAAGHITILLHKPVGYVCSRDGQGSPTVYDLLPPEYRDLKIAGRLDRDSSGLLILTSDGDVIQQLTHPTQHKEKTYLITTQKALTADELGRIQNAGVDIGDDRLSRFLITPMDEECTYKAVLQEGRNRQIRRTIEALHNRVVTLERIRLGTFTLDGLNEGKFKIVTPINNNG